MCMMRADAHNFHVDPVKTEMTNTQHISISHVCDLDKSESKEILVEKNYRKYVLRTRANHKSLSPMKVIWRRANQKAFTKLQTQIKKNMQLMKQIMSNLRLQIIQL